MTLRFESLSCRLGGREILKNLSGEVPTEKITAVLGPNGCGKSTLLRCLLGLIEAQGKRNPQLENEPLRAGYLPQAKEIYWPLTCSAIAALGHESTVGSAQIEQTFERLGIGHLQDKRIDQISGGERTLVLLARALAGKPAYVIADEPIAELDPAFQLRILKILREEALRGAAVLITMHDINLTAEFCSQIYLMRDGRIEAAGGSQVLNIPNLKKIFGISFTEEKGFYGVYEN